MVGENSCGITNMKESINENTKQISGIKDVIDFMSAEEERLLHLEAYSRWWNLRVHGVPEGEREDVRGKIINICQQLLPDAKDELPDADGHRLGRKRLNNKPRGIIIQ
ncbi:Cyclin-K [Labeo rohita]|uniref:Cyclin-K n=1 Tax=Labeo rohita TaxID=84645 RepID=A0ABQ8LE52_LABRO|nr:Cyclin-K [Labeo rohita]